MNTWRLNIIKTITPAILNFFYKNSRLLVDYMKYLLTQNDEKASFISASVIDMPFRFLPFAFAILDLPFEN
jgi:hypothetical protein